MQEELIPLPASKRIDISRIKPTGEALEVEPAADLYILIAEYLNVEAVSDFKARLKVMPWADRGAHVTGSLTAEIEQACVVTGDPVSSDITINIDRKFIAATDPLKRKPRIEDGEMIFEFDEEDDPDEITDGRLEIWEMLLEEVLLVMDPFPRSDAGVELEQLPESEQDDEETETYRPFSGLNALISEKNSRKNK
jgi:uncharacterized metal-binding protein YceD (DUF177 family)